MWPFAVLLGKLLTYTSGGGTSVFSLAFNSASTLKAIMNTVVVGILVAVLSCIISLPLAWIFARTDLAGRHIYKTLFSLPYAIPPFIGAMAWISLANPSTGILNTLVGKSWIDIYGMGGLIWVEATFLYTFVLLNILGAMERLDSSLEEAARISGASPARVFFDITLPLIRPALLSGVLLVFLASAASFGVPALIGTPRGLYLLTTRIYTFQKMGSINGIFIASSLSIILLLLALIGLFINQYLLKKSKVEVVGGKSPRPSLFSFEKKSIWVHVCLCILISILFFLPILGIIIGALAKVQGVLSLDNLGLQNFVKVFLEIPETANAVKNSFLLAATAATAATGLGLLFAFMAVKGQSPFKKIWEFVTSVPFATPGTVLALAFILAFGRGLFGTYLPLYNSLTLIALIYIVKYINFSFRASADGLRQIHDCLAEASLVSGAGPFKTFIHIWIPLLKTTLLASWFLVFMPSFSELTMTILLTGPGLETLGTLLFQLHEYGDASGGGAQVLALFIVAFVICLNFLVKILSKGKYGL